MKGKDGTHSTAQSLSICGFWKMISFPSMDNHGEFVNRVYSAPLNYWFKVIGNPVISQCPQNSGRNMVYSLLQWSMRVGQSISTEYFVQQGS